VPDLDGSRTDATPILDYAPPERINVPWRSILLATLAFMLAYHASDALLHHCFTLAATPRTQSQPRAARWTLTYALFMTPATLLLGLDLLIAQCAVWPMKRTPTPRSLWRSAALFGVMCCLAGYAVENSRIPGAKADVLSTTAVTILTAIAGVRLAALRQRPKSRPTEMVPPAPTCRNQPPGRDGAESVV
jgi:hypothetical protein